MSYPLLAQKKKKVVEISYDYLTPLKNKEEITVIENKLEKLFHLYCGKFSNELQAEALKKEEQVDVFYSIQQELINIPIWTERIGEYWFYSGWFISEQWDKPLTHTIAKMTRENRDTFKLTFYQLPKEEDDRGDYSGEWMKENAFQNLKPKQLVHTPGCENYIIERGDMKFEILASDCPLVLSDQRHYLRYKAIITLDGIHQYTEYLDANKQVSFAYKIAEGLYLQRLEIPRPIATKKKGK